MDSIRGRTLEVARMSRGSRGKTKLGKCWQANWTIDIGRQRGAIARTIGRVKKHRSVGKDSQELKLQSFCVCGRHASLLSKLLRKDKDRIVQGQDRPRRENEKEMFD